MTMERPGVSSARTKRPHSPDTGSAHLYSAPKRTRKAGSKNLKQHEWALVHQHLLRRNQENKDTVFVIHGVKQKWHNVHRKILRARPVEMESLGGMYPDIVLSHSTFPQSQLKCSSEIVPLSQLPSYIELRTPSPGPATPPQIDAVNPVNPDLNLASSLQRQEEVPTPISPQSPHATSGRKSDGESFVEFSSMAETAGNACLRYLPVSEFLTAFRRPRWFGSWHQRTIVVIKINVSSQPVTITLQREDTLETLVNKLYAAGYPGPRIGYLEMIRTLNREDQISRSYFLEAVFVRARGREYEILKRLLQDEIDFSEFGTRALGTAAYRNDFRAVEMLLNGGVDVNGTVSSPHSHPDCRCRISVTTYAQLRHFDREGPGASDEMIAYLLRQGATLTGVNMGLLGLLCCALKQNYLGQSFFLSKIQKIVQRIHGFADFAYETASVLETCIFGSVFEACLTEDRLRVFKYLLDQGARMSYGSPLAALILRNYGPWDVVEDLLAKVKNINGYCNLPHLRYERNYTLRPEPYNIFQFLSPLQAAAILGQERMIRLLLDKGADANCPARGAGGVTPLQGICFSGDYPSTHSRVMGTLKLLLHQKGDVNAAPAWDRGLTALQAAAFVGNVPVAELLVSHKADPNAPACKYGGGTALALAARRGHADMVRFLLKAGAAIPGTEIDSIGVMYDDYGEVLDLLGISDAELEAQYGGYGTPSRDWHEYEAEWAKDPTYKKG